ncbi:LUD domain-containing protein, partial [Methanobrevibacter woesei]
MKEEELETMRKSFDTVKNRSSKLESSKIDRLEKRVKEIAENSINNMDSLREIAIESFKRNGIDVFCASDAEECQNIIYDLVKDSNSKAIAKAKSNTLGEINLKPFLADKGFDVVETDLGDRILQLKKTDNKPVHPTGPASHLNVGEITDIVNESMDVDVDPVPREIMEVVREDVLDRIENCTVGISGANVIAAEEGAVLLVHNEGNISLVSLKDLHIIVAGIDKIVPSLEDAISIAKLETVYATGNYLTSYVNIIS